MQVENFVEKECLPAQAIFDDQLAEHGKRWEQPKVMEDLKKRAKELGLWNLFLPKNHYSEGAGFTNLEYGLMAEYLGKSRVSQEVSAL
jgi:acyl-CoA dehydrogenase